MTAAGDVRARVAAALAGDPDIPVHDGYVDALAPPAYVLATSDPWGLRPLGVSMQRCSGLAASWGAEDTRTRVRRATDSPAHRG